MGYSSFSGLGAIAVRKPKKTGKKPAAPVRKVAKGKAVVAVRPMVPAVKPKTKSDPLKDILNFGGKLVSGVAGAFKTTPGVIPPATVKPAVVKPVAAKGFSLSSVPPVYLLGGAGLLAVLLMRRK